MQHKNAKSAPKNYQFVGKKTNLKILTLFPSLNYFKPTETIIEKRVKLQRLNCLYVLDHSGSASISELSIILSTSRANLSKKLKVLLSIGLVEKAKVGRTTKYVLTTKGLMASMAFLNRQKWTKTKAALSKPQKNGDPLAYALLTIGYAANSKSDTIYDVLDRYAAQGYIIENIEASIIAESLLNFYRTEIRTLSSVPPNYLGVFREFTTSGFQDVFRMLMMAIKPTAEDYNWLVEFFSEVVEFYYDPARVAYVNLLEENKNLKNRLEKFKNVQDELIKKEGPNLEMTFTIPSAGLEKIDKMPPHLRAIGMRLILEPIKFINIELCSFFWENKKEE